jgi:2',3'-cyclic-nucleotide 2'-phosphodiesterase (5'-nucleotidase family)
MVAACKQPSRQLDTPIGTTAVELDSRSTTVRSRETAIGALIANAMRWSAQTEVAMTNGGGIRGGAGSIRPARPSRGATVLAELPFGNTLAHAQASVLLADRAHDARSRAAVARGALHLLQDRLVVRGNRRH